MLLNQMFLADFENNIDNAPVKCVHRTDLILTLWDSDLPRTSCLVRKSIYKINKITAALFIGANLLAWMLLMVLPLTKYYVSFHDICISFHCMIYGHFTMLYHTFISFTSCKFNAVNDFFPVNFATFDNLCQLLVCKSWTRCRTMNLFEVHIFPTNSLLIGNLTTYNPKSKVL